MTNSDNSGADQLRLRLEPLPNTETIPAAGDEPEKQRVYGVIWHGQNRIGLYSADLFVRSAGPRAVLSVGLNIWSEDRREWEKQAVAIEIRAEGDEYAMTVLEANRSPFADNGYLGRVMHRDEFLQSPVRETFFQLANHIANLDPKISGHFG